MDLTTAEYECLVSLYLQSDLDTLFISYVLHISHLSLRDLFTTWLFLFKTIGRFIF